MKLSAHRAQASAHTLAWLWAPRLGNKGLPGSTLALMAYCYSSGSGDPRVLSSPEANGATARLADPSEPQPRTCPPEEWAIVTDDLPEALSSLSHPGNSEWPERLTLYVTEAGNSQL